MISYFVIYFQGHPLLLVGTTDSNRKFHLIGVCVSTHEKSADFQFIFQTIKDTTFTLFGTELKPLCLISDAAYSIKNGYVAVFGDDDSVIMCWAHLRRAAAKKVCNYIRDKKKTKRIYV